MRTIRMTVIALCAALAACNLYWHDSPRSGDGSGNGRPDAGDGYPDAWVIDDAPPDAGSGNGSDGGCHGGDAGGLPDAGCDNGGSGCGLPDASVEDGGCNGVDCYPDARCDNGTGSGCY